MSTNREDLIARLDEYANMLERADVHDDMGLSMTHTDCADVMRDAAALLRSEGAVPSCALHGPMRLVYAQHRCDICGSVDEVQQQHNVIVSLDSNAAARCSCGQTFFVNVTALQQNALHQIVCPRAQKE